MLAAAANWLARGGARRAPGPVQTGDPNRHRHDDDRPDPDGSQGHVAARGRSDTERLRTGELVYAGVQGARRSMPFTTELPLPARETPPDWRPSCSPRPWTSTWCSALLASNPLDFSTADGRPATAKAARDQLAQDDRRRPGDVLETDDARRLHPARPTRSLTDSTGPGGRGPPAGPRSAGPPRPSSAGPVTSSPFGSPGVCWRAAGPSSGCTTPGGRPRRPPVVPTPSSGSPPIAGVAMPQSPSPSNPSTSTSETTPVSLPSLTLVKVGGSLLDFARAADLAASTASSNDRHASHPDVRHVLLCGGGAFRRFRSPARSRASAR